MSKKKEKKKKSNTGQKKKSKETKEEKEKRLADQKLFKKRQEQQKTDFKTYCWQTQFSRVINQNLLVHTYFNNNYSKRYIFKRFKFLKWFKL